MKISAAFNRGELDLSARSDAPSAGWDGMPEIVAAKRLRSAGITTPGIRVFMTFLAAMDRAREADSLWLAGANLFAETPWVFTPPEVASRTLTELANVLASGRVSQRHGPDSAAWRRIAEALAEPTVAPSVHTAVYDGRGDAVQLLEELRQPTPSGPKFPFLSGPKIGPMWVRMLAYPGEASISSLKKLPVSVDVQVRKVTEYLGVTDTRGKALERIRAVLQQTWAEDVDRHGCEGPPSLRGTAAALDPALWFYGKWGCTRCEWAGRRIPISEICEECRFDSLFSQTGD